MKYTFEFDEIVCCSECPFYYESYKCVLMDKQKPMDDYTWLSDGYRPEFCPLTEVGE